VHAGGAECARVQRATPWSHAHPAVCHTPANQPVFNKQPWTAPHPFPPLPSSAHLSQRTTVLYQSMPLPPPATKMSAGVATTTAKDRGWSRMGSELQAPL